MKTIKRMLSLMTLAAVLGSSVDNAAFAQEDYGYGYYDSVRASAIDPGVVVGAVVIAGVIAVCVHNRKHHHGHGH